MNVYEEKLYSNLLVTVHDRNSVSNCLIIEISLHLFGLILSYVLIMYDTWMYPFL